MPMATLADLLCSLRKVCGAQAAHDLTDLDLLRQFHTRFRQSGFTTIVLLRR
jgi:hypothetical protein